jgi:hypothetical protein
MEFSGNSLLVKGKPAIPEVPLIALVFAFQLRASTKLFVARVNLSLRSWQGGRGMRI